MLRLSAKSSNENIFSSFLPPKLYSQNGCAVKSKRRSSTTKISIPLETGGFSFSQHVPPELDELKNYGGIPYDFKSPETTFRRLARALQLPSTTTTVALRLLMNVPPIASSRRFSTGAGLTIVLVILIVVGLIVFAPRFFQQVAAASTATPSPTTVVPSPTDQPTFTLTPTPEPSLTPLPPSATPSPTD